MKRWCHVHRRWEDDARVGAPPTIVNTPPPSSMMPGFSSTATPPAPSSSAAPAPTSTATSIPLQAGRSRDYAAPLPAAPPTYLRAAPPPSSRAMPSGTSEAVSSGPPAWYLRAHDAVGGALVDATETISSDPSGPGSRYAENARDVFYLDKLTEFLRQWEADLQKRANAIRKPGPFH
jgi:hypothetical protein